MAQFVTHIQPTLMEAQHHHPPHYYHHHHKECHSKDCHNKDCKHKDHDHHKDVIHKECTTKGCQSKDCHKEHHRDSYHKECNVKDCRQKECHKKNGHHDKESLKSPPLSEDSLKDSYAQIRKGSQGHFYIDSHGNKHEYDIHFVDQQGIFRESEVRSHDSKKLKEEYQKENEARSLLSKSEHEIMKPIPPQFIDIQPAHVENKLVSTLSFSYVVY